MSSLIISHDLHIMMLELAVEKLFVPRKNIFDEAILKKTTVMFRLLDDEWTALYPQRSDYHQYRGSNYESEPFHGGKSILFSLPEASLENSMKNIDLQMHITKDVSHYFEMHTSENIGYAIVNVDNLFNGIINELKDRKELGSFLHYHKREPISRSLKGDFSILDENSEDNGSHIEIYVRLSYFGKSIITEILKPTKIMDCFYVQEETNEKYPYQCRELEANDIANYWNSVATIPPVEPQNLQCDCQSQRRVKSIQESTQQHMSNLMANNEVNIETMNGQEVSEEGKANENLKTRKTKEDGDISTKDNKRKVKKNKKKESVKEEKDNNEEEAAGKENKSRKINKAKKSTKTNEINSGQKIEESNKTDKKNEKVENLPNEKSNKGEKSKKDKIREKENLEKVEKGKREFTERGEKTEKGKNKESTKENKENKETKEKLDRGEKDELKSKQKVSNKEKGDNERKGFKESVQRNEKKETIDRKKKQKEEKANFDSKEKRKLSRDKIDSEKIKLTRRENAGPITVGIWEKKNSSCLEISPQCSCQIVCNSQIYNSLLKNDISCVDCPPERQISRNNLILPSCYSEIFF